MEELLSKKVFSKIETKLEGSEAIQKTIIGETSI